MILCCLNLKHNHKIPFEHHYRLTVRIFWLKHNRCLLWSCKMPIEFFQKIHRIYLSRHFSCNFWIYYCSFRIDQKQSRFQNIHHGHHSILKIKKWKDPLLFPSWPAILCFHIRLRLVYHRLLLEFYHQGM